MTAHRILRKISFAGVLIIVCGQKSLLFSTGPFLFLFLFIFFSFSWLIVNLFFATLILFIYIIFWICSILLVAYLASSIYTTPFFYKHYSTPSQTTIRNTLLTYPNLLFFWGGYSYDHIIVTD